MQQRRSVVQKITVNAFFRETGFSLRILALIEFATTSNISETLHNFSYLQFFCPGKDEDIRFAVFCLFKLLYGIHVLMQFEINRPFAACP